MLEACTTPVGLRPGGAVGHGHHLLSTVLLVLFPLVAATLGRGRVIAVISTTEVADGLDLAVEVGLDDLLVGGILDGDVQELPRRAWGLAAERVDERLAGRAADEGIDHVSIGDVGELVALLGEVLDVLLEGLVGPLPVVAEVPCVPKPSVCTLEVTDGLDWSRRHTWRCASLAGTAWGRGPPRLPPQTPGGLK